MSVELAGSGEAGEDGLFSVGVPAGSYVVRVGGEGWGTVFCPDATSVFDATVFEVQAGQSVDVGVVALIPEGVVSGQVANADGSDAAGVAVRAVPVLDGDLDPALGVNGLATAGADGGFTVGGLPAGDYVLVAAGDNHHQPSSSAKVSVTPGEQASVEGPLVRGGAGTVTGEYRLQLHGRYLSGWIPCRAGNEFCHRQRC